MEQSLEQPHRAVIPDQVVEVRRRECQLEEGPGSMQVGLEAKEMYILKDEKVSNLDNIVILLY